MGDLSAVVDDPARLAALREVRAVESLARPVFDRLARLAAAALDAPVGLVNFVDAERQHFAGCAGLSEPWATTREFPTEWGFCPFALAVDEPLLLSDVGSDSRFAGNPARGIFGVVAYAGIPLRTGDGQPVGTLCVIDTRVRDWAPRDRAVLEGLAEAVMAEVAVRQQVDARDRLTAAFEDAPVAIAVLRGPEHVFGYANPAYLRLAGRAPRGVSVREAFPDLVGLADYLALLDRVLAGGETIGLAAQPIRFDGDGDGLVEEHFITFSYSAIRGPQPGGGRAEGVLVTAFEVSEAVRAGRVVEAAARRHELLARAAAALNRRLEPGEELQALAAVVVPELADLASVHLLAEPVEPGIAPTLPVVTERVAIHAIPGIPLPSVNRGLRWDGGDPITEAIRHGSLLRRPLDTRAASSWAGPAGSRATVDAGVDQLVAAPVLVEGLVGAVIAFGMCHGRPAWSEAELDILEQITGYAGVALARGITYQRTRDAALVLQRAMLSPPPDPPGLQIAVRYQPAGREEVGGDWYDVFPLGAERLGVVVGDVVGHDITAAAAMGAVRTALRTLAVDRPDEGPSATLGRLARLNEQLGMTRFATVCHGVLTRAAAGWSLCWASAGHPAPLLVDPDGTARYLDRPGGVPIHRFRSGGHPEATVPLPPGATLLFYTDGLIENRPDVGLGMATVAHHAAAGAALPLEELCDQLLKGASDRDDVAILALRVDPDAEPSTGPV